MAAPLALRSMVLPPCPMAEFVVPRHSAVMERLRRRIELCRRHHSACESRYQAVSPERLELERQQTFALHQRCLQAKAKRAGKHRQPPPAPPPPAPPPPAAAVAGSADRTGANGLEAEAASGEQHGRSSTLIAVRGRAVPRGGRGGCAGRVAGVVGAVEGAGGRLGHRELSPGAGAGRSGEKEPSRPARWPAEGGLGLRGYSSAADGGRFVFSLVTFARWKRT